MPIKVDKAEAYPENKAGYTEIEHNSKCKYRFKKLLCGAVIINNSQIVVTAVTYNLSQLTDWVSVAPSTTNDGTWCIEFSFP